LKNLNQKRGEISFTFRCSNFRFLEASFTLLSHFLHVRLTFQFLFSSGNKLSIVWRYYKAIIESHYVAYYRMHFKNNFEFKINFNILKFLNIRSKILKGTTLILPKTKGICSVGTKIQTCRLLWNSHKWRYL